MAVYTDVSYEELEGFLARYDAGAPLTFKGIAEGVENSNYYLKTTGGAFVLTLYEKRVRADDLPFFLGLLEHLAGKGLPCPTPVRDRAGATHGELNGRPAALLRFLEGISLARPKAAHCAAAARALAELHRAGADFASQRPNALGPSAWRGLAAACAKDADAVEPGLNELIARETESLARNPPRGLPEGIIHGDLFPDNVLFQGERVSGLIDFYFACNDALAYDLAVMLNAWCFESDGTYNMTKGRSLLAAYDGARKLSPAERAALPALSRGAALRFLLTRLYDWINRDANALVRPKDPREFARKLRFHQTAKSAMDYGL